ncbi:MAG: acyltransferase, partial [Actinobacteria bacterium]|nr:acyltransferase [Actinomycetota bacterium]
MAYMSDDEVRSLGFRHVGRGVKISTRAAIYDADRISIGDHSRIDDFTVLAGNVEIGRNVHVTV